MSVDPKMLDALATALDDLTGVPKQAMPAKALEALAPLARPGTRLKIDLEASAILGAPLVTVSEEPSPGCLLDPLTPRQRMVAEHLIAGRSNKEIARALGITVATVKDHVHAILERLELPTRAAVMAAARGVAKS